MPRYTIEAKLVKKTESVLKATLHLGTPIEVRGLCFGEASSYETPAKADAAKSPCIRHQSRSVG